MALKIVTGRAGSGKTKSIIEDIRKALMERPEEKIYVLVPEQYTLQSERDIVQALELPGLLSIEVLSFSRLAERTFATVGGSSKTLLNDQGKEMLLRKVMLDMKDDLKLFSKCQDKRGFLKEAGNMLSDIKKNRLAISSMTEKVEELDDEYLKEKLIELGTLLSAFNDELQVRWLDAEDYYELLINKLQMAEYLKDKEIFIDGFITFTVQTIEVIKLLVKLARNVTISLPWEKSPGEGTLFQPTERVRQALLAFAGEANIQVEERACGDSKRNEELSFLEKNLFAFPYKSMERKPENIFLSEYLNREEEIDAIAKKILWLVRQENYRFREITVICNAVSEYEEVFRRIFSLYDIPFFIDTKKEILSNRFIEYVLDSLNVIIKNFTFEEVFKTAKTGFTLLTPEEVEKLENYCLSKGIERKRFLKEFPDQEVEVLREKLITPLRGLAEKLDKEMKIRDFARILYAYLEEGTAKGRLLELLEELKGAGKYEFVHEYTQIWNVLMENLDQMVEIMGADEVSLEDFCSILNAGLSSRQLGIIPTGIDQVLVGSLERSRSHNIGVLFMAGLNEGIIPKNMEESALLSEKEKDKLKNIGFDLAGDVLSKGRLEKLGTYLAFGKPEDKIYLSYPLAGSEGEGLRPSSLVKRVKNIYPTLTLHDQGKPYMDITSPQGLLAISGSKLHEYLLGKDLPEELQSGFSFLAGDNDWQEDFRKIHYYVFDHENKGKLDKQIAELLYGEKMTTSISRLEKQACCPFSYFLTYGLRPEERKALELDSLNIGNFFHESLYRFFQELEKGELGERPTPEDKIQLLDQVMDEVLTKEENLSFRKDEKTRYLGERFKQITRVSAKALLEQLDKGQFTPQFFEVEFGVSKALPPVVLELSDGKQVFVEGKIDRIDLALEDKLAYFKILDYKSSRKDFDFNRFYHGLSLQLILYLEAMTKARQALGDKELVPAGAFYFSVEDKRKNIESMDDLEIESFLAERFRMTGLGLKDLNVVRKIDSEFTSKSNIIPVSLKKDLDFSQNSSVVSQGEMNELMDYALLEARELTEEIYQGNIEISPYKIKKEKACFYCDFKSICQFESKSGDSEYRRLADMKDIEVLEEIKKKVEACD